MQDHRKEASSSLANHGELYAHNTGGALHPWSGLSIYRAINEEYVLAEFLDHIL